MTMYFFTPEQFKEQIDYLAKKKGFKFFVITSDLHGVAHAPSKKVNLWRVPVAISNVFAEGKMSIWAAMKGFYFIGVSDIDVLDEEAKKSCEEDVLKQLQEESDAKNE